MTQYVQCPWCGEDDFDLVGLKLHLEQGRCQDPREKTDAV